MSKPVKPLQAPSSGGSIGESRELGSDLSGWSFVMVTMVIGHQYVLSLGKSHGQREAVTETEVCEKRVLTGICWPKGATNSPRCRLSCKGP